MFAVVDSENHYSKLTKKRYNTVIGHHTNKNQPRRWWHLARRHSRRLSEDGQESQANGCATDCRSACQSCLSTSS